MLTSLEICFCVWFRARNMSGAVLQVAYFTGTDPGQQPVARIAIKSVNPDFRPTKTGPFFLRGGLAGIHPAPAPLATGLIIGVFHFHDGLYVAIAQAFSAAGVFSRLDHLGEKDVV